MAEEFTDKIKRLCLGNTNLSDMVDEIDQLRKDKERLDWLGEYTKKNGYLEITHNGVDDQEFRVALDKAMNEDK